MNVRQGTVADARAAAKLHATEISEGFLSSLGWRFLARLYRRVALDPQSFLLVAEDAGSVVGMAAGTANVGALYRSFLLRDGIIAAAVGAPRLVRAVPTAVETLRYGRHAPQQGVLVHDRGRRRPFARTRTGDDIAHHNHVDVPPAELLAVAVDRSCHGRGVGRQLVAAAQAAFAERGVAAARVVAGADNDRAIALYEACGFRPIVRTEVHAGVESQVLAWP